MEDIPLEELAAFAAFQEKVRGTNINPQTLLATDYLNHFNEIIMLLDMVPDMPECLDEAKQWAPKSYQDHFRGSAFSDRALAIEAYDHVPPMYRRPFEEVIGQMNRVVGCAIERIDAATAAALDLPRLRVITSEASRALQLLMDYASAVIHGSAVALDQAQIDGLLDQ